MAVTQDRLEAAISQVLAEMERRFAEVERRFSEMERRFGGVERRFAEQTRWIVGTGIAVAAVIVAAMKL